MRVALFTDERPDAPSGLVTTLDALLKYSPHDVELIPYYQASGWFSWARADQMIRRALRDRIDVVHLTSCGPAAAIVLFVAWRLDIPVVGSFPTRLASTALGRRSLRALSERCERVFVSSVAARDMLVQATPAASNLVLWRPGVDAERFAPSKRSAALRERWEVSDSRPAVIYVGALAEENGARGLLALELALRRSDPMHRLIVVGDGPGRAELQRRCSRALFLGAIPPHEIPHVLASADVFVCPSEAPSANHAVLEAQASGVPGVVMARGSGQERICGASGVLCRSHVDVIVETAALVRTAARRKGMARAAREYALRQRWDVGLAPLYAGYRMAAAISLELKSLTAASSRR